MGQNIDGRVVLIFRRFLDANMPPMRAEVDADD